jgi:hypothetical protein
MAGKIHLPQSSLSLGQKKSTKSQETTSEKREQNQNNLLSRLSYQLFLVSNTRLYAEAQFIVPDGGDKVDYCIIGLSYRFVSLYSICSSVHVYMQSVTL